MTMLHDHENDVRFREQIMKRCALLLWMLVATDGLAQDKRDAQAKEAIHQFMKALTAQDIDATMKVVDVPFFWDGVENIKDRAVLKAGLEKIFARNRLKGLEYDLKEMWTFAKLPENMLHTKDRKLVGVILEPTDRVALVLWRPPGRDGLVVLIRLREGAVKIVGFRD